MADDYRTTEVGERYAQALFDLADETGVLDAVRADLTSLRAAWKEHEVPREGRDDWKGMIDGRFL